MKQFDEIGINKIILGCTHFDLIKQTLVGIDNTKEYISSSDGIIAELEFIKKDSQTNQSGETHIFKTKENLFFDNLVNNMNVKYSSNIILKI